MVKRKIRLFIRDVTNKKDGESLEKAVNEFLDTHRMAEPPMMCSGVATDGSTGFNYVTVMCQYYDGEDD